LDAPKDAEPVLSPRSGTRGRLKMHLFLNMLKCVLKPWHMPDQRFEGEAHSRALARRT